MYRRSSGAGRLAGVLPGGGGVRYCAWNPLDLMIPAQVFV